MKKPVLLLLSFLFILAASAQKVFFLYVQSEDQSPFYLKMSGKIYSSASSGFLVISNLSDSTYSVNVGFANKAVPEQSYKINISGSDKGLLLKSLGDGLSVVDLNNDMVLQPVQEVAQTVAYETKTDRFSTILSKAADDPGLLRVPIQPKKEVEIKEETAVFSPGDTQVIAVKNAEPLKEEVKEIQKQVNEEQKIIKPVVPIEDVAIKSDVQNTGDKKSIKEEKEIIQEKIDKTITPEVAIKVMDSEKSVIEEAPKEKEYKISKIKRASKKSTSEGAVMVYYDATSEGTDTIRIIISNPKVAIKQIEEPSKPVDPPVVEAVEKPIEVQVKAAEPGFVTPVLNSACSAFASDKDFLKLRKNMAGKETDELMVDEAKKFFKKQCFTTEQLKNLSALFLTSAGKYQFFDAAYFHVADKENFKSLQLELKDEYYLKRFKALSGDF